MFRILACSLLLGLSACAGEGAPEIQAEAQGQSLPACTRQRVEVDDGIFLIFFDRGSERLTDRARTILAKLAQHWLENRGRALTVVGHTDASETKRIHRGLGARRAQTAAAYLVELGIPADRISVGDAGAYRPLVSTLLGTPPGAPEPQNRFVDFDMRLNGNPMEVAAATSQRALCIEWLQKTYCDKSTTKAEERACSNAIRFRRPAAPP